MNTLEILIAARAKIEKPEHWTTGVAARTKRGAPVECADEDAVCFCALGAIWAVSAAESVYTSGINNDARRALELALRGQSCVPGFNDNPNTTHADVLALYDRAIVNEYLKLEAKS